MISVHRVYEIKDISHNHAHIEINPVGVIDIEIVEKKEHHWAEFKDLSFQIHRGSHSLIRNTRAQKVDIRLGLKRCRRGNTSNR